MNRNQRRAQSARILAVTVLAASLLTVPAAAYAKEHSSTLTAVSQSASPVVLNAQAVKTFADDYFAKPELEGQLAGALAVVVQDGQVLLNEGYGYADLASKKRIDPNQTLFRMASITKSITATAVMQLVEQGAIDLNEDISVYMPDIPIANATGKPVTVKHLLTHTTGFDYTDSSSVPAAILQGDSIPLGDFIRANAPSVVRTPGEIYRYDNMASSMQGYIVERVSGEPFEDYVERHIFAPLKMNGAALVMDQTVIDNLAAGYNQDQQAITPYPNVPTIAPDGGMFASGSDMANFIMAQLGGGQLGTARILKEDTVQLMQEIHVDISGIPLMSYGFESFYHSSHNGHPIIGKGGDLSGFHSWLWLIPDQNVGGLIVVNSDLSASVRDDFFVAFMERFYPDSEQADHAITLTKAELLPFEGMYRSIRTPVITTKVTAQEGMLRVRDGMGDHTLTPIAPLRFIDEQERPAAFKLSEDGEVAYMYYTASDSFSEKIGKAAAYDDVPSDDPYAEDINFLRSMKLFGDEGQSSFRPNEPMTRAEFVSIISRLAGMKPTDSEPAFRDLQGHPLAGYVQNVVGFGVITGTPSGSFEPDRAITRQEAAAIVWRTAHYVMGLPAIPAELSTKPAPWADEAVQFIVGAGIHGPEVMKDANGLADFRPAEELLRKEAAAIYAGLIGF